jgi:hypothetical protein
MKNTLSENTSRFESLRNDPEFPFGLAREFVTQLLSLPREEKYSLFPLFKLIEEECFSRGIVLPNLNYDFLLEEKIEWESKKKEHIKKRPALEQDDFNDVLFHVFKKYESLFSKVKGYFLFKLENVEKGKTEVVFLCDEDCRKHPEILSFDEKDEFFKIEMNNLSDFTDAADRDILVKNRNYLCVLVVTPNLRYSDEDAEQISKLNDIFSKSSFVSIKNNPVVSTNDYELLDFSEGQELITSYATKVFNNRALSFDDELVIKKLFEGREMILDYKFLKSGNTGAKVIEIQPLKGFQPQMSRFVVKYAKKSPGRKINAERKLYREFVANYSINSYSADYEQTSTREAIKYQYASSDGKTDSYQFADIVAGLVKGEKDIPFPLGDVMSELINCEPFKKWGDSIHSVDDTVANLYKDYLMSEKKVFKVIGLIKNINEDLVERESLIINYNRIKNLSVKTCKKICHGDLHSENFFKDEKGVYLIDFGWTGYRHSVIDYATLECSIKFKHIPLFIPMIELEGWERKLLHRKAFETDFDLSFIDREIPANLFSLILQLREETLQLVDNSESTLEYLISLFILSFRQIQYSDLNQRYAVCSAEILGEEIIRLVESLGSRANTLPLGVG